MLTRNQSNGRGLDRQRRTQHSCLVATSGAAAFSAARLATNSKKLVWRPDVDPRALPESEMFTPSQRAILLACVELFGSVGYAGTSVRDIAALVGIKSASLYKSFATKQAMLDALNAIGHTEFNRRQIAAVLAVGGDPREQLAATVRCLVGIACAYPRLTRIVNSEVHNLSPAGFDRDQAARLQSAAVLQDILTRGREQGLFVEADEEAVTVVCWSLALGLASWFPFAPQMTVERLSDSYVNIVLRMVGSGVEVEGETAVGLVSPPP